jgi:hypothetical protein
MATAEPAPEGLSVTVERIDQLIALFNKKGMDLPAGLFDRATQFLLNGAAYETLLGRSPDDPLILMLARGPSGYRFIVKALQHAVPDASIQRGALAWRDDGAACEGECWLMGRLRGSGNAVNAVIGFSLSLAPSGCVRQAAVTVDAETLALLRAARLAP